MKDFEALAKNASDVMNGILIETEKTSKRIESTKERLHGLQSKVPEMETALSECAPAYFYDNPYTGAEYLRKDPLKVNELTTATQKKRICFIFYFLFFC